MKKFIFLALSLGVSVIFFTQAVAKKESGNLLPPNGLAAQTYSNRICFSWGSVDGAAKYSIDVAVDVDVDRDNNTDKVVEFSFGTGDRTDGGEPSDPNLCVPLSDFVSDLDDDGVLEQVSGMAHIKVKALNPGKGNGRQNNAFSNSVDSPLAGVMLPPDPVSVSQPDPLFLPLP